MTIRVLSLRRGFPETKSKRKTLFFIPPNFDRGYTAKVKSDIREIVKNGDKNFTNVKSTNKKDVDFTFCQFWSSLR